MRIGFIGLGAIGAPIASRLREAGHGLLVYDIRPEATAPFAAIAQVARSARELGERAEVIFACLASADAHRLALVSEQGASRGRAMRLLVNLGTVGAPFIREIAAALQARGVDTLDAPVTGGVGRARDGSLTAIISGPRSCFDRIEPLMASYASKRVWMGPQAGGAQVMKVVNNAVSLANLVSAGEALIVGARAGLDPATMIDVINHGSGQNSATLMKFPAAILNGRFNFGGALRIVIKDLEAFIAEAASQGQEVPHARLVLESYRVAAIEMSPDADVTEVVRPLERRAGVELRLAQPPRT